MTDTFFTQSVDGGVTFRSPNVRVSSWAPTSTIAMAFFHAPQLTTQSAGDYEAWPLAEASLIRFGRTAAAA